MYRTYPQCFCAQRSEIAFGMFSLLHVVVVLYQLVTTFATLTGGPVSVSALVEEDALFHCTGAGANIAWIVDGLLENEASIIQRGISSVIVSLSGTVQSTLTVPAILMNNGTTVQCVIYPSSVISNNATLTILPSIGPVVNVRFTDSFSDVLWDPPATAGVLSGLMYRVIVMNNNTGQVIVSDTTNNTHIPLPVLQLCQYYTANVTAFSSQHHSDSVITGQRIPGEYYHLRGVLQRPVMVINFNATHSAVTFNITIQQRGAIVCPDQKLMLETYSTANTSVNRTLTEVAITQPGVMQYTLYVEKSCHCISDIMIVADDKVVSDRIAVLFSTYAIQDCDVSSDTSSILVECTFAINSTAPGIVVIQDDQSQYTINKTLQRLLQDSDKGSVNITGLPAGEYSVRVYDNSPATDSTSAAYQHSQLIHIIVTSSQAMLSTIFPSGSYTCDQHITPSVVLTTSIMASVVVVSEANVAGVVSIGAGVTILVIAGCAILFITVAVFIARRKTGLVTFYWRNDGDTEDRYQIPPHVAQKPRKEPVYADIQHDSTGPAVPLPLDPVQYATVMKQASTTEVSDETDNN